MVKRNVFDNISSLDHRYSLNEDQFESYKKTAKKTPYAYIRDELAK
ncbi:MAG: hypothetical protein U9O65_03090 [Thermotogota bacterium]|nr:hypothetical protein [Thermotogota bacterium]